MAQVPPPYTEYFRALLKRGRLLLVTDLDGTIVPAVSFPEEARIHPGAKDALRRLIRAGVLVAVLTGRGGMAAERLVGVPGVILLGANGAEIRRDGQSVLVPEFVPHAAVLSEHLKVLLTWLADKVASSGVHESVLGDLILETPHGPILVERKGQTADAPNGVSHMYYFTEFRDTRLRAEILEQMQAWSTTTFVGALADLIACEASEEGISFTPFFHEPKWHALVRLLQEEGVQDLIRSLIYVGDADVDAPTLRLVRLIDRLTEIRASGAVVIDGVTMSHHHTPAQDLALEAATIRLNGIDENVAALASLASLAEQQ